MGWLQPEDGGLRVCNHQVVFNNKAMVYAGAGVCAVIGCLSCLEAFSVRP